MVNKCPKCGRIRPIERSGLCFECYQSLNSWILNKCKELKYTKIRTGLVLIIALQIAEWLKR